jgi:3-phosphoshikimate 1-carboxyvinyltransferase
VSAPTASPTDVARIGRAARIRGTLEVPGDKSISHRSQMLSALAEGRTTIRGILD